MPIEYTIHHQGTLVYAQASGRLTDEDLVEHERRLLQDARVASGFRQLLDCRWVADDQVSECVFDSLSDVYDQDRSKVIGARYAIVAQTARWFRAGAQHHGEVYRMTVIVFNDPSTACIWLGANYFEIAAGKTGEPPPVSDDQRAAERAAIALNQLG